MHLARELGKHLGMGEEELELVTAAGLLHDIGHGPFSHATEDIMVHKLGMTHEERTGAILTGKVKVLDELGLELGVETLTAREILESYGIDPRIVAGIATGTYKEKPWVTQMVNGELDVDRMDYLIRDSYYTGTMHGVINKHHLLESMRVFKDMLVITEDGLHSAEGLIVAREFMYGEVYFQNTKRIAETMITKAVEYATLSDNHLSKVFHTLTDSELLCKLAEMGRYQRDMVLRVKYGNIFEAAILRPYVKLVPTQIENLLSLRENPAEKRELEEEIAGRAGLEPGYVIIDVPPLPELREVEVVVLLDDGTWSKLHDYSPFASSLLSAIRRRWTCGVYAPQEKAEKVGVLAKEILFGE